MACGCSKKALQQLERTHCRESRHACIALAKHYRQNVGCNFQVRTDDASGAALKVERVILNAFVNPAQVRLDSTPHVKRQGSAGGRIADNGYEARPAVCHWADQIDGSAWLRNRLGGGKRGGPRRLHFRLCKRRVLSEQ